MNALIACMNALTAGMNQGGGGGGGGVGHDHVCAIFADSAPSNVCEFPIIQIVEFRRIASGL